MSCLCEQCDLAVVAGGSKGGWLDQWEYAFAFARDAQAQTLVNPKAFHAVNQAIIELGEMGVTYLNLL